MKKNIYFMTKNFTQRDNPVTVVVVEVRKENF